MCLMLTNYILLLITSYLDKSSNYFYLFLLIIRLSIKSLKSLTATIEAKASSTLSTRLDITI